MMRPIPVVMGLLMAMPVLAQRPIKLQRIADVSVAVEEPSDMVVVPESNDERFYMVSDNGYVAEVDRQGKLVRRSTEIAFDLEGCTMHEGQLMVVDERSRRILWLDTKDLSVQRRLTVPYGGGRNKGYEALVWHPLKERFLLITERDPVIIFELDRDMRVVNEVPFDTKVRDISSATWHDGHLWLLSDMDMVVLKCDPNDHRILERYSVPIINPEGFAFGADGLLYVVSDDRQRMYTFQFAR